MKGKQIALLVAEGFEEIELTEPKQALEQAGAKTFLVAPHAPEVRAWDKGQWGRSHSVDLAIAQASAGQFDALLLPGGLISADQLRLNSAAVRFVKQFFVENKPVAAIGHGPWMLVEANVVKGRSLTSYPSISSDLANAGGKWLDLDVVADEGLVTSRRPDDLPAFLDSAIKEFAAGRRKLQIAPTEMRPASPPSLPK